MPRFSRMLRSRPAQQLFILRGLKLAKSSQLLCRSAMLQERSSGYTSFLHRLQLSASSTPRGSGLFQAWLWRAKLNSLLTNTDTTTMLFESIVLYVIHLWIDCKNAFIFFKWARLCPQGEDNLIIPIHAYPVMDTADYPLQLKFPQTAIGDM